jgi:hypothetical protein
MTPKTSAVVSTTPYRRSRITSSDELSEASSYPYRRRETGGGNRTTTYKSASWWPGDPVYLSEPDDISQNGTLTLRVPLGHHQGKASHWTLRMSFNITILSL